MQKLSAPCCRKPHITIICNASSVKKLKKYLTHRSYRITAVTSNFKDAASHVKKNNPQILLISDDLYQSALRKNLSKIIKEKKLPVILINEEHINEGRTEIKSFENNCIAYPKDKSSLVSMIEFVSNCKKEEVRLLEDCRWLLAALMNIGDGAIVVNAEGRILFMNTVAEKLTGKSKTKSIHTHIDKVFKAVFEKNLKPVKNPIVKSIKTKKMVRAPMDILLSGISKKSISIGARATPIIGKDSQVKGAVLIFWDVTMHLKAKKALEISEENYRTLVESANSIILRTDYNGRITFSNKFAQKFLGYKKEELIRKNIGTLIFHETKKAPKQAKDTIFSKLICRPNQYSTIELKGMRKSGEPVWISWTCKTLHNEADREMLWVGNDITDLKNTQTELKKAHDELEQRVEKRTAQLARTNEALTEEVVFRKKTQDELSKAYQKIKNAHAQLIQSEKMAALGRFSSGIAHEIKNPLGIIISGVEFLMLRTPVNFEFFKEEFESKTAVAKFLNAISKDKYISVNKNEPDLENLNSALRNPALYAKLAKKLIYKKMPPDTKNLIESTEDIRKQKFEEMFEGDRNILRFFNRKLLETVYGGLCPVHRYSDYIMSLLRVNDAVSRADKIVGGLLKFAKPSELKTDIIKPQDIIEESINQIPLEEKTHITFKTSYRKDISIEVDENQIMQVLINIIVNAAQSISKTKKGIIKIKTYISSFKKFAFGRPVCVIEIKDNGIGIDKESMQRLFEPFFTTKTLPEQRTMSKKINSFQNSKFQGSGLGLSVSKSIINTHKGEMFISSVKGKGTTVKIALPLHNKNK